jgi:UDP-N-acetylglucosamine--N-acetylmuramyl-(pentapeptide) pyrophosphoryl-undecaprenol N-acetylglucosamine transferase
MRVPATFLFAGGGTGGHIFPGLAIAEELRDLAGDDVRTIFLCSNRPLDARILSAEAASFHVLGAQPFGVRPRALVRFVRSWGPSLRASRRLIRAEQDRADRVEVVAMGGFVAAPAARAARLEGARLTLVNMDAVPGKANRWIAKMADRILTSAPVPGAVGGGTGGGREWRKIPPIVRRAALAGMSPPQCSGTLGLDPGKPTLLVTGASQGARSMNRMMMRLIRDRSELLRTWQIVHQTGAGEDDAVREAYASANIPALVRPFFDRMGLVWGAADLAVSRAGAGSIAEAWANRTPTIFLPYPYHRDQHQRYNAQPLEEAGGALVVTDLIDEAANVQTPGGPGATLSALIHDVSQRERMRAALVALGPADGARQVAASLCE